MDALPLIYYPTTWVLVDDDIAILYSLSELLGTHNRIKTFQSPKQCLEHFNSYTAFLEDIRFLNTKIEDETYDSQQNTPIDFNISLLSEIAASSERYNQVTAMVIDYEMPLMNGFLLADKLKQHPIYKILLTGRAQPEQAIEYFNKSIVQQFIQKGDPELLDSLIGIIREQTKRYFQRKTQPLLSILESEHPIPLSDKLFIQFFEDFCLKNNIEEYYLIDKQGSFLCIKRNGDLSILVVHSEYSLKKWLNNYHDQTEINLSTVIRREKIPFFGIGKDLWQVEKNKINDCLYDTFSLSGRETYYMAVID